jgi:hypothetical protein
LVGWAGRVRGEEGERSAHALTATALTVCWLWWLQRLFQLCTGVELRGICGQLTRDGFRRVLHAVAQEEEERERLAAALAPSPSQAARGTHGEGAVPADEPTPRIGKLVADEHQQQQEEEEEKKEKEQQQKGGAGAAAAAAATASGAASRVATPPRLLRADGQTIEAFVPASV